MGDPRKARKKYETPGILWQAERIKEEVELKHEYGVKNKKEIWKINTQLKRFKERAKKLLADNDELERERLVTRLVQYGLIKPNDSLDVILGLGIRDLMERRLQTVLVRKGLARSAKQARQMITHQHVTVNGKKIDSPSYIVTTEEENTIVFADKSAFADESHPERALPEKEVPSEDKAAEDAKKVMEKVEEEKAAEKKVAKEASEEKTEAPQAEEKSENVKADAQPAEESKSTDTQEQTEKEAEPAKEEAPKKE